jgi:hypothetical protein
VRDAKDSGKTEATVRITGEGYVPAGGLARIVGQYSVIVATVDQAEPVVVAERYIRTWYRLRVSERLTAHSPAEFPPCAAEEPPPSLRLKSEQLALPVLGGAVVVHGVKLMVQSPQSSIHLVKADQVVAIVNICATGVALLPFGAEGLFHARPDGTLQTDLDADAAWVSEMGTPPTLAALRRWIQDKR